MCAPAVNVEDVIETGEAVHAADPSTVAPSFKLIILPIAATQTISKVGVVLEVILSVLEVPVSEAVCKSGAPGADGAKRSIVIDKAELMVLIFPAGSVCLAEIE